MNPPRWRLRRIAQLLVLTDVLAMTLSVALASVLRTVVPDLPGHTSGFDLLVAGAVMLYWVLILSYEGAYDWRQLGSGGEEYTALLRATAAAGLTTAAVCYFADSEISRAFLGITFAAGAVLLTASRFGIRQGIKKARRTGGMRQRVLVVGDSLAVQRLGQIFAREQGLGYDVIGCSISDPLRAIPHRFPAPIVGSTHDVGTTCARIGADTVVVASSPDVDMRQIAWDLEGLGIELIVTPQLTDVAASRLRMRPVAGLPMLHVEEPQARSSRRLPKRAFDLVVATAALVLMAPVLAAVALLIKLGDRGPVFFRQERVGLNGETIRVWKFRSMVPNAAEVDAQLRREHDMEEGLFKLVDDPRITPVGKWLRRYSLDEFPQLFNVLDGSMSLVGPRPFLRKEIDAFGTSAHRRLNVRPGMTGLWQVSGRSNLTTDDAVRLDLYYRDNWSMSGDLFIMLKTVKAVLRSDGAY